MYFRFEYGDIVPKFDLSHLKFEQREKLKIQQVDWRNNKRRLDDRNYVLKQLTK